MLGSLDPNPRPGTPIVLLLLLLLVLLPGFAHAQTRLTFTPRVSVEETYDDNITLDSNGKNPDWITTVSPGFGLAVDSPHTQLNIDFTGGYSFYLQDSDRDTTVLGSTLSLDQRLSSRFSMHVTDAFARTDDPITEEEGVITDVSRNRAVRYSNTGEAGISYEFGPVYGASSHASTRVDSTGFQPYQLATGNRVTVGYRNRLLESRSDQDEDSLGNEGFFNLTTWFGNRFGIELTGGVNRVTFDQSNDFADEPTEDFYDYTGQVTLNYRWNPSQRVFVTYRILDHRFDQTAAETGTLDYRVHQSTIGVSLGLGPRTSFDAEGGYWFQDVDGDSNRNGFTFNTALTTRREKLSLRVGGSGGYEESYFTSENLGFSKYYQAIGSADYQVTAALAAFASGSYRWQKYYDTEDAAGEDTDRTDKIWQATAGFRYTFLRHLSFSLAGAHIQRSSSQDDEEFTDNRVTARLTWAYGIPF